MAKKILGYILAVVGVIGLAAWSFPTIKNAIPNLSSLADTPLLIISIILAIVGIFFVMRGGRAKQKSSEVPIYHGKSVVGYRRH